MFVRSVLVSGLILFGFLENSFSADCGDRVSVLGSSHGDAVASSLAAASVLNGQPRPEPLSAFQSQKFSMQLSQDPFLPDSKVAIDQCLAQCTEAFKSIPKSDQVECSTFNESFTKTYGDLAKNPRVLSTIALEADQTAIFHPTRNDGSVSASQATAVCLNAAKQSLKETAMGPVDAAKMVGNFSVYLLTGGPYADLWKNKESFRDEFQKQISNCTSSKNSKDCALEYIFNQEMVAKRLGKSFSALTSQVMKLMGASALGQARAFRCSNSKAQIRTRCELQARIYSELFMLVGGAEIVELLKVAATAGEEGLAASKFVQKMQEAARRVAQNSPKISQAIDLSHAVSSNVYRSGLKAASDVAEASKILKEKYLGRLYYGSDFLELGIESSNTNPSRFIVKTKSGQYMELRPGDPLFEEVKTKYAQAKSASEKSFAEYNKAKLARDAEIRKWDVEHGLFDDVSISRMTTEELRSTLKASGYHNALDRLDADSLRILLKQDAELVRHYNKDAKLLNDMREITKSSLAELPCTF